MSEEEEEEEEELEEEEWQGIKCGTMLYGALQTRKQRLVFNTLFLILKPLKEVTDNWPSVRPVEKKLKRR